MIKAKTEFKEWAEGFSGCDGGNLKGPIWFCGIEYGGDESEGSLKFEKLEEPPEITEAYRLEFVKYQYNQKVLKIYAAMLNRELKDYRDLCIKEGAFAKDSELFKLNLYPIAFHNDSDSLWEKWLCEKTGFPTKPIYRAWCQINRFKFFYDLVQKYSPKIIIGTGRAYKNDFLIAFGGIDNVFENSGNIKAENIDDSRLSFEYAIVNNGKTILVISPFLGGRYGLSSDVQIESFGRKISEICDQHFGQNWRLAK